MLYPPTKGDTGGKRGYRWVNVKVEQNYLTTFVRNNPYVHVVHRPEDHQCPEQDEMQKSYVKYLQDTLEFHPSIMTQVKKTMKKVAKRMGLKTKEVTYVGVHNRKTDSKQFVEWGWYQEELQKDYFEDAMEYYRYVLVVRMCRHWLQLGLRIYLSSLSGMNTRTVPSSTCLMTWLGPTRICPTTKETSSWSERARKMTTGLGLTWPSSSTPTPQSFRGAPTPCGPAN